ncbi:RagB/SusD family nutrient uptake outer membrane protein [Mucilaginibacter sabulilitoris]|uniref:RagB/SusD family nutrient uptake outer membrane protein n=1 Tax=Mucilaginibacter sabulilitoris TaxID=1173583 RepID=A0ABZ0TI13_9SPHI|nr:RagB/SusD family nutrient uptake outer membrane protein [Mucilaginibacter sabulilitoris]WPU92831.1 RagB/SusD family nutrient uptake outer membrane protein [Mucilaginibacter sabulilitoris]
MKTYIKYIAAVALCLSFTQCKKSYLDVASPSSVDDNFVTTTTTETFKSLSWCYANYRQNCIMGVYRWNDPVGSDAEYYPEDGSTNNLNAIGRSDQLGVDAVAGGFNSLYQTLALASRLANVIAAKDAYKADVAAGKTTDWTQLYGEAMTMRAFCYFQLTLHFGDVPYGYENTSADDYSLTSRFDIYDSLIDGLKKAEPLMYNIGQGNINQERMSRTFCDALMGQIALFAGGYQTIRTDVSGLYGSVTFTKKGTEANKCVYARRTDYLTYYQTAKTYLQKAIDNKGTAALITTDSRGGSINNPFQRHFQYFNDLTVSPESIFEIGNIQGGTLTTTSEYPYAFGRPSDGGSSVAAPTKTFGALRIIPTVYYGEYENADHRRDASATVTASNGDGNEKMISFTPGSKSLGGIATNKWDDNRMATPNVASQRSSGINWPVLRMADVILMLAEVKAELGENDAVALVNQIRQRAFGNALHNISVAGQALKDAILEERKLELLGEGTRRWDMIRSGTYAERAIAVQQEMAASINDIKTLGYHHFANGNDFPAFIWIRKVALTNPLTYDCPTTDTLINPAAYPAWRGQYNYSANATVASKVVGTTHNIAIQGLFRYIDPAGAEAAALQAAGYTKTNWGIDLANAVTVYQRNILSGTTSAGDPPRIYWPIPSETISKSKGKVTNGYGLAQQ